MWVVKFNIFLRTKLNFGMRFFWELWVVSYEMQDARSKK